MRSFGFFSLLTLAQLGCSPMMSPDAGRMFPDAGPARVVDGGLVRPFTRGEIVISQIAREVGIRTTYSSTLSAQFFQVVAPTPAPCLETTVEACTVSVCNLGATLETLQHSAGALTFFGLLPPELRTDGGLPDGGPSDGGLADAGLEDGGSDAGTTWVLGPTDAGWSALVIPQRLFFGGDELSAKAEGASLPPFSTPVLSAPAQLKVIQPRCVPTCSPVSRAAPLLVEWGNVSLGETVIQLTAPQVTISCTVPASTQRLSISPAVLAELPLSTQSGEATLIVKARQSVQLDAGGFDIHFSAETPTFLPIEIVP